MAVRKKAIVKQTNRTPVKTKEAYPYIVLDCSEGNWESTLEKAIAVAKKQLGDGWDDALYVAKLVAKVEVPDEPEAVLIKYE